MKTLLIALGLTAAAATLATPAHAVYLRDCLRGAPCPGFYAQSPRYYAPSPTMVHGETTLRRAPTMVHGDTTVRGDMVRPTTRAKPGPISAKIFSLPFSVAQWQRRSAPARENGYGTGRRARPHLP
jgi:hypothetical protein